MKNKLDLKKCYIGTGIVAAIPTLYFIVEMIVYLCSDYDLSKAWKTLNWIGVGLYGLCVLMLIALMIYSVLFEKKENKTANTKANDANSLKKYQSKNK